MSRSHRVSVYLRRNKTERIVLIHETATCYRESRLHQNETFRPNASRCKQISRDIENAHYVVPYWTNLWRYKEKYKTRMRLKAAARPRALARYCL